MKKKFCLFCVLFLCTLYIPQGIAYGQLSTVGVDLHPRLLGMFTLTDQTPRDGYISIDEFVRVMMETDFNGDNCISRQEWIDVNVGIDLFDAATASRIFDGFDADKNGVYTIFDIIASFHNFDAAIRRDGRMSCYEFLMSLVHNIRAPPKKII